MRATTARYAMWVPRSWLSRDAALVPRQYGFVRLGLELGLESQERHLDSGGNRDALRPAIALGQCHSRRRADKRLWRRGAASGCDRLPGSDGRGEPLSVDAVSRPASRVDEYESLHESLWRRDGRAGTADRRAPAGTRVSRPKANRMPEPRTRWLRRPVRIANRGQRLASAAGQAWRYGCARHTPPGSYQATSTPGAYQPPVGQQPAAAGPPAVADAYGAGQQPAAGYGAPPTHYGNPPAGNPAEPNANNYAAPNSAPAEQTAATQSATPGYAPAATDPNAGAAPSASAYQPGNTGYVPGQTGYNPPGTTPYQMPGQPNVVANTRKNPYYRPGGTSDYVSPDAAQSVAKRRGQPYSTFAPRATPRRLPATPRPPRRRARRIPMRIPHPRPRRQPVHLLAHTKRLRRRRTVSASVAPVFCR